MGKLQGNRRSASRPNRPSTKAPVPRTADPSLGFPTIPLEELARQQNAKPVTDLEEFGSLWPPEFDPDEFLQWLAGERAARRQTTRESVRGPR